MDATPQERFLKELSDQVLQQDVNGSKQEKDCFIRLRFHPSNYEIDNYNKQQDDLCNLIKAEINCRPSNIQRTQKLVIQALLDQYQTELNQDNMDIEKLINPDRGEKGIWRILYQWLWNYKFPRWQFNQLWQQLKQQATPQLDWIKFVPTERGMYWEEPVNATPTIPSNLPLRMLLTINHPQAFLLLLNRGSDTGFLVCPSLAFAPENKIEQVPILLPQPSSIAAQKNKPIEFRGEGNEEYLAIVSEQPIEIDGLTFNTKKEFPRLEYGIFNQLWQQLQQQQNWRVFYQSFQVVNQLI